MKNQDQVNSKNVKSKHQVYRKLLKNNPRWTGTYEKSTPSGQEYCEQNKKHKVHMMSLTNQHQVGRNTMKHHKDQVYRTNR